ncbi:MAG: galactonate dehydratase [Oscillospiraceae bacterium]|jgi:galactonate dehydratase|nr:galactonate dehydratase [Oscillospiraceae bacterium]
MKITDVKVYLAPSTDVYVKIETDEGLFGWGEPSVIYMPQSVAGMLRDMRLYLIGQDPERIELIWQSLFRDMFMRGGPSHMAAISGVDMALWDIKAKACGKPLYQLLGGLAHDKLRVYGHVSGKSAREIAANAKELAGTGVTMIRYRGFHNWDPVRAFDMDRGVNEQVEYLAAIREAVGSGVDIIVECHGRYDPVWAIKLAQRCEPYHPFFIEDPIRQENTEALRNLRAQSRLPLAAGERYHNRFDFRDVIVNQYLDYVRPDICHCGGVSEMKKIAALAETYYIGVVPHNTQGPLAMTACLHTAFTIDNVPVVEAVYANPKNIHPGQYRYCSPWPSVKDGYVLPPQGPGLGMDVDEEALISACGDFKPRTQPMLRGRDGSVKDW